MAAVRQTLAGRLMAVQNNYVLGLASIALLSADEVMPFLRTQSASFGQYSVTFDQVAEILAKPAAREESIKQFLIMLMCSMTKDTFELTRHHCKAAGRLQEMQAQPWYQFARLVRNCIAHNFLFEFTSYDRTVLPVTWKGCTLTAVMDQQELPLAVFGYVQAWELFAEFRAFAARTGV